MNIRLVAKGQELDMFEEVQLNVTYSIEDILNLESRRSEYTKDFNLPGTKKNKEFFDNIQELNIDIKRSFLIAIPAQIYVEDKLIIAGSLRLISSNDVNGTIVYQVQVTGRFRDLMSVLEKLKTEDLDFSYLNHQRNSQNIINSWSNDSGYVYPYIVNGHSNDIFDSAYIWDLFPALFVKDLIDEIFDKTDFIVESKFLNSDYFKSLIIPWNRETIQEVDISKRILDIGVEGQSINIYDGSGITQSTDFVALTPTRSRSTSWWNSGNLLNRFRMTDISSLDFTDQLGSWQTINVGFIPPPVGSFPAGQWVCQANGLYNINFNAFVFPQYNNITGGPIIYNDSKLGFEYNYRLVLVKNNGANVVLDQTDGTQFFNPGTNILQDFEVDLSPNVPNMQQWRLSAENVFMEEGDIIQIRYSFRFPSLNFSGNNDNIRCRLLMKRDFGGEFSRLFIRPAENKTWGNEFVDMNKFFTKGFSLRNLFLDLIKMFNLIIAPDKLNPNQLVIEPREDYWLSRQRVKTWEWDRESQFSIRPMSEINFNKYEFNYLQDSDYLNEKYRGETQKDFGSRLIEIDNDFSEIKATTQLSVFSPTPLTNAFTDNRIAPYFVNKETNELRPRNVNMRILFYKGLKPSNQWFLRNSISGPGQSFNQYPYCGPYDDPLNPNYSLNFGVADVLYHPQNQWTQNNLFNKFHKSTFEELVDKNNKLIEAFFPLTTEDIADLDYRDLILLEGGFYRINQIKDYNPNSLVRVELYKVNITKTYDLDNINIPITNRSCPNNIYIVNNEYYKSDNGPISEDCCNTLGGKFEEGVCKVQNTGVIIDVDIIGPVVNIKPNFDFVDLNSINSVGVEVKGTSNYVSKKSKATQVIGNDSSALSDSSVIGNRITADRSGLFYINDVAVDEDGDIINIKPYIINGGKNTTLPNSRSNVVEIVHGGVNAVRNSGGDVKRRVLISDSDIGTEFGTKRFIPITNLSGSVAVIQREKDLNDPFPQFEINGLFGAQANLDSDNILRWDFQVISLPYQVIPTGFYYVEGDFTNTWSVKDNDDLLVFTYSGGSTTCGSGLYVTQSQVGNTIYETRFEFYLCGDTSPYGITF